MIVCAVIVLAVGHAAVLGLAATRHSATHDECAHLAAGLRQWEQGRFDLYSVNPPLARYVGALPVLFMPHEVDWSQVTETPGSRPEFATGYLFTSANGANAMRLYVAGRWACVIFGIVGALVCFAWSRELFGSSISGLIAMSVWCLEPTLLAHAELITPDCAGAACGLAASWLFWRWLIAPSWPRAIQAGVLLGLAEACKFTWVILFPLWPALWILIRLGQWTYRSRRFDSEHQMDTERTSAPTVGVELAQLAFILLSGLYLLNASYMFDGTGLALGKYRFVSGKLNGFNVPGNVGNRFEGTVLQNIPVPFPRHYVVGMDLQNRDFEASPYPNYLNGEWSDGGWWYYYLWAVAIKSSHGLQLITLMSLLGIGLCLANARPVPAQTANAGVGASEASAGLEPRMRTLIPGLVVLLVPAIVVFVIASARTEINQHVRYVLPCFACLSVFAGASWLLVVHARTALARVVCVCGVVLTLGWMSYSTIRYFPDYLAYFNESVGGPEEGRKYLVHSNLDWGQGLVQLNEWMNRDDHTLPVYLAYHGDSPPVAFGVTNARSLPVTCRLGKSTGCLRASIPAGTYVISANLLAGFPALPRHYRDAEFINPAVFAAFRRLEPTGHLGYSLVLFEIPYEISVDIPNTERRQAT